MTIEIHSPNLKVSEKTLAALEKKVLSLSQFGEKISRAEIFLTEDKSSVGENKDCKVRLDIFGDTLFAHKTANSFEKAGASVIKILKRRLKETAGERNIPPDEKVTTVNPT